MTLLGGSLLGDGAVEPRWLFAECGECDVELGSGELQRLALREIDNMNRDLLRLLRVRVAGI